MHNEKLDIDWSHFGIKVRNNKLQIMNEVILDPRDSVLMAHGNENFKQKKNFETELTKLKYLPGYSGIGL